MPKVPPLQILKASAGSGKTFALTIHFIRLLLHHEGSYKEILALTFTNKATAEMKSRILEVLEGLARGTENEKIKAYQTSLLLQLPQWTTTDIQQKADSVYRRILHDYSHFSVNTIDGFSQKIIRGFAHELGLDGLYLIEMNTDKVRRELMKRLYLHLDNHKQLFDWLIERILNNIEQDKSWNIDRQLQKLSNIIFSENFQTFDHQITNTDENLLFTNIAKYNKQTRNEYEKTFQDFITQITTIYNESGIEQKDLYNGSKNFIPKFIQHIEAYNDVRALDNIIAKTEHFSGQIDNYQRPAKRNTSIEQLYQRLNPVMENFFHFLTTESPHYHLVKATDDNLHYLRLMKQMSIELAGWRTDNNAQLISDAQLLLNEIGLSDQGDPTFIWEKIGNRYRYFLFDEFQDTSNNQWKNLYPLLSNALAQSRATMTEHLIVGDIKQSIYRWRNGDWRILLDGIHQDIRRTFHTQNTQSWIEEKNLPTNYRSEKNIVEFNNFVVTNLPIRLQTLVNDRVLNEVGEIQYSTFWQDSGMDSAIVRAYHNATQKIPDSKTTQNGGSINIEYLATTKEDEKGERKASASELRQLACEKTYNQIAQWLTSKTYQPQDIGLLVRTNEEARLLVDYFAFRMQKAEKAFAVISGDALLMAKSPIVKVIIDTLRFMLNENKEHISYLANIIFYYSKIKGKTLTERHWIALQYADLQRLYDILPSRLISEWNILKQQPIVELTEQLIACYGFGEQAENLPVLFALRDMATRFSASGDTGLSGFLLFWEEECDRATIPTSENNNAIEIITIHKSKGLEYPVVIIPFCSWSLDGKPDTQVWFDVKNTAYRDLQTIPLRYGLSIKKSSLYVQYYEEMLYNYMDAMNYLYVALTRASEHLYVIAPEIPSTKQGEAQPRTIGHVLEEILRTHPWVIINKNSPLSIQYQGEKKIQPKIVQHSNDFISLPGYKSSTLLFDKLKQVEQQDVEHIELMERTAAFSNTIHELMSQIQEIKEIPERIQHLITAGLLRTEDQERIKEYIQTAWEHPKLGTILNANYKHINERAIINQNGETVRPDKVLYNEHETIVIDFKSTIQTNQKQHIAQINKYRDYLVDLGFPNVQAYLYYFIQNRLVEV